MGVKRAAKQGAFRNPFPLRPNLLFKLGPTWHGTALRGRDAARDDLLRGGVHDTMPPVADPVLLSRSRVEAKRGT